MAKVTTVGQSQTRVKICGITNIQDAELAIELGADALGFVYEPTSPRFVGHFPGADGLARAVGPFTVTVGVLGPWSPVPRGVSVVQSIGEPAIEDLRPHLRVLRLEPGSKLADVLQTLDGLPYAHLDAFSASGYGGTGHSVDWDLAAEIVASSTTRIVLAGGLTPDNVGDAVRRVRPYAVDVSSGVEATVGKKDPERVKQFIEAARSA